MVFAKLSSSTVGPLEAFPNPVRQCIPALELEACTACALWRLTKGQMHNYWNAWLTGSSCSIGYSFLNGEWETHPDMSALGKPISLVVMARPERAFSVTSPSVVEA